MVCLINRFRKICQKRRNGLIEHSIIQINGEEKYDCKELTRYDMQGHPKFKKRGLSELSFYMRADRIKFENGKVKLENISTSKRKTKHVKNWVRLSERDRIPENGKYYNPRIKFDGLHWYLSVSVEEIIEVDETTDEVIGIDLNIGDLAHCSDGNVVLSVNKEKRVLKAEKRKKRLQRSTSRSYHMNNADGEWQKTGNIKRKEKRILKLNKYLANVRTDHLHKESTKIVNRKPRLIVMEDLNVRGMMANKHLARVIQNQKWYSFRTND